MKRELTCIVCPLGCRMTVELERGEVVSIIGNTCARGKKYACDECTHPMRTLTTIARTERGGVIPVKTASPIPKERMFDAMKEINDAVVKLPARIGDVVIHDLLGTGVDVIVTAMSAEN